MHQYCALHSNLNVKDWVGHQFFPSRDSCIHHGSLCLPVRPAIPFSYTLGLQFRWVFPPSPRFFVQANTPENLGTRLGTFVNYHDRVKLLISESPFTKHGMHLARNILAKPSAGFFKFIVNYVKIYEC